MKLRPKQSTSSNEYELRGIRDRDVNGEGIVGKLSLLNRLLLELIFTFSQIYPLLVPYSTPCYEWFDFELNKPLFEVFIDYMYE